MVKNLCGCERWKFDMASCGRTIRSMIADGLTHLILLLALAGFPGQPELLAKDPRGRDLTEFLLRPTAEVAQRVREWNVAELLHLLPVAAPYRVAPAAPAGRVDLPSGGYYLYELPEGYDAERKWPAIFSLHGNPPRHCERVHYKYWRGDAARRGFILISPNLDGGRWHREIGEETFFEAFRDAVVRFHLDQDRLFLNGYSAGATGTWNIGSRHPDLFAGIVVRCGIRRVSDGELANLKGRGVYVIHAVEDSKCGIRQARLAVDVLKRMDVLHRYVEYPGEHDFYPQSNEDVLDFLSTLSLPEQDRIRVTAPFDAERRILGFVSLAGDNHTVSAVCDTGTCKVDVTHIERLRHLDVWVRVSQLSNPDDPVSIILNGTPLDLRPTPTVEAFLRSWMLHPSLAPQDVADPFLACCRVARDGQILTPPDCGAPVGR